MNEVKKTAREFLSKYKIKHLPVDMDTIARQAGYTVQTYSNAKKVLSENLWKSFQAYEGITLYINNGYYILYRDDISHGRRQQIIAHEIGHILLHPKRVLSSAGNFSPEMEAEADEFERCILAPLDILSVYRVEKSEEIERLTGYDKTTARKILNDLKEYKEEFENLRAKRKKYRGSWLLIALKRKKNVVMACLCAMISVGSIITSLAIVQIERAQANPDFMVYLANDGFYHKDGCARNLITAYSPKLTEADAILADFTLCPCAKCREVAK